MQQLDLAIRGGTIVTAADTVKCDVGVSGGRIAVLAAEVTGAVRTIDATGKWITPGIIDVHSHLGVYASPGVTATSDGNEQRP